MCSASGILWASGLIIIMFSKPQLKINIHVLVEPVEDSMDLDQPDVDVDENNMET